MTTACTVTSTPASAVEPVSPNASSGTANCRRETAATAVVSPTNHAR